MSDIETKSKTEDEQDDLPRLPTWKYLGKLMLFQPWLFVALLVVNVVVFAVGFQVTGFIMRAFFDTLTGDAQVSYSPYALAALVVAVALARTGFIFGDISLHVFTRFMLGALLRKNMFSSILDRPGARAAPGSPG